MKSIWQWLNVRQGNNFWFRIKLVIMDLPWNVISDVPSLGILFCYHSLLIRGFILYWLNWEMCLSEECSVGLCYSPWFHIIQYNRKLQHTTLLLSLVLDIKLCFDIFLFDPFLPKLYQIISKLLLSLLSLSCFFGTSAWDNLIYDWSTAACKNIRNQYI